MPEERHAYVLKRERYLLHGQNNTKKITAVARTKQHEDNCCLRTVTRRRERRYRHKAGGNGPVISVIKCMVFSMETTKFVIRREWLPLTRTRYQEYVDCHGQEEHSAAVPSRPVSTVGKGVLLWISVFQGGDAGMPVMAQRNLRVS